MASENISNSNSAAEARSSNNYGRGPLGDISKGGDSTEFWDYAEIDETHWNKSFPYQLVVLKKQGNRYDTTDTFTLPINPTELSISSPFAITTSVTLGGIVEEHNGSPIKIISIQGSTGFFPFKGSPDTAQSLSGAIIGGTLQGVNLIQGSAKQIVSGGNNILPPNLVKDNELNRGTGYFQFMLLRNFLEAYANLKKTAEGRDYRLAFMIWKDSESWLVSPMSFDLKRTASSAMEYMYSIQLKAWNRYSLDKENAPKPFEHKPVVRNPNALASALNSFRAARGVLVGVKDVITGFRADVDHTLFLPLRETGMFIKDFLGIGLTAGDLPHEILLDAKNAIVEFIGGRSGDNSFTQFGEAVNADAIRLLKDLGVITGIKETQANPIGKRQDASIDLADLGPNSAHPANKVFEHPEKYYALFESIQIGSLHLKPSTVKKILEERQRVRSITRLDFENHRDRVISLAADYADFVGAGSSTFSTIYNRPQPVATRTPTDDDWEVLYNLNQVAMEFNRLAASTATDTKNRLTAMEYLAGQAGRSGIPFTVPVSAFTVPFPYGSTLEVLSNKYLGTPDRWHEIAILNNLRPPYVDEVGITLLMLTNGSANSIQVSDGTNLYINQTVWLASSTVAREKRRITGLRSLSSTVWVVDFDGVGDLDKFTAATGAELFTFLPGTANSLQLIYIPSDQPPAEPDFEPKGNETIDEFNTYLQVGGVDLLLTNSGDLAITNDGDCRLSIGLANIVQHVKLVLNIEPGTLLRHPDVGFAVRPGTSTADVSAQDILKAAKSSFANDRTFTGIGAASIVKNGPSMSISLSLGVSGISHFVPVSFVIRQ